MFTTSVMHLSAFAFVLSLFAAAYALPVAVRDVFVPHILAPVAGAVWPVGSVQNVTWDVSDAPKQITNGRGRIFLAKGGLFVEPTIQLAEDFDILNGFQLVTVPDVAPDSDYAIVLFGDSGNISEDLSIVPAETGYPPTEEDA